MKTSNDPDVASGDAQALTSDEVRGLLDHLPSNDRRDLRTRLADALETWLNEHRPDNERPLLLPSARNLADTLGIHRATIRAAIDLLITRRVLRPTGSGRFVTAFATQPSDSLPEQLGVRLREAAGLALVGGVSASEFTQLAGRMYMFVAAESARIVFVYDDAVVPGMGPQDLERQLEYPVFAQSLSSLEPQGDVIYVTHVGLATAVREVIDGTADVFLVGLTLDTNLRLAVAGLPADCTVLVTGADLAKVGYVAGRVEELRPDLHVAPVVGTPDADAIRSADLILADHESAWTEAPLPLAPYRYGISNEDLTLIRRRLPNASVSETMALPDPQLSPQR